MPGTIQVSVLDFKGLFSSTPSSSISIKVSIGKRGYQTWEKGDFSFPLTTLRENLIVTLQDAEGNEISHTGVQIMSIVEKGFWDDIFSLEGGGHVHMKLQFILSEEERKQIRIMRDTALKKKQGEIINTSLAYSEHAKTIQDVPSVVPSETSYKHNEVARIQENATDRAEVTSSAPMSQRVEVHHRTSAEQFETRLPINNDSTTPVFMQQVLSMLGDSESTVAANNSISPKQENNLDKMQGLLDKTPSNEINPRATKSQSNRVGMEGPLKDHDTEYATKSSEEQSSGRLKSGLLSEDMQQTQTSTMKRGEHIVSDEYIVGTKPSQDTTQWKGATHIQPKETNSSIKDEIKVAHKEMNAKELVKSPADLMRPSTFKIGTISGGMHEEYFNRLQPCNPSGEQRDSASTLRRGICSNNLLKTNIEEASNDSLKSVVYCEEEHYFFETSGSWIFTDDTRCLCITTGGNKVMDFLGGRYVEVKSHQEKKTF